jgi:DNA-binding GntR family transcriptional regulator
MPPISLQPTRRNKYIRETLAEAILRGALPPGLVLTQSNVSRHFGVSRAPAADALDRLAADGIVFAFDGRGYIVGPEDAMPLRLNLSETDLEVAPEADLGGRSWRETLYPAVETEVAGCVSYGTFVLGSAALARHYGFSRTTSHEMLSRLERVGLIEQAPNGRWLAPGMTPDDVRDHYQIRTLLEPVAVNDAAATESGRRQVFAAQKRIAAIQADGRQINRDDITALEADLHKTLALSCGNVRIRDALHRSQLPLIATHTAFGRYADADEMQRVLRDHSAVLEALARGDEAAAASAMVAHLEQGMRSTMAYIRNRPAPPDGLIPPYMTPLER